MKIVVALTLGVCLLADRALAESQSWTLVHTPHFEIYSQTDESTGRSMAVWLEQLRAFSAGLTQLPAQSPQKNRLQRVIVFNSEQEYATYQIGPAADAYFVGSETADYIVIPGVPEEFQLAAHEYAHLVVHSLGLRLPRWLSEGFAEVFSTVQIAADGSRIGTDLPARTERLKRARWIPLSQLVDLQEDAPMFSDRKQVEIFYAESWALTDMLMFSPAYAPRFNQLVSAMQSAPADTRAIERLYAKPVDGITEDLRAWVEKPKSGIPLPATPVTSEEVQVSSLPRFESDMVIADLLLTHGDVDRAESVYRALASERPDDPRPPAALGTIALRKEDKTSAGEYWKRALQLGIKDAELCYEYAVLAQDAELPADEVITALDRAIKLRPDFDDARYKLGLLQSTRGNYDQALEQFRAMRTVPPGRAYAYWTALATALTETDQRAEAKEAAKKAVSSASTPEQRSAAQRLAYVADTDLTVQFARDEHGDLQMVTARKPHGSDDWNPFVEPTDQIVSLTGRIRKVECSAGEITAFRIESGSRTVEVALPDPAHVLITGGAPEFTCDSEDGRNVAIQYAASQKNAGRAGILRGMQFQ